MKLRSLTLSNVRKFGGHTVVLDDIGDGVTVVSEANEFGKSTFFDALHAVFFERYSASSKSVKSLQPHAGGGVRIAAVVETAAGRFRIEKRFLAQKGATVEDLGSARVIARDGEAEDWIAALTGSAEQGPAGLLWVRQGVVGLEPADGSKTEKERLTEARRDLVSSVAGEIEQVTGGRRMDRVLRRCNEDFDRIATRKTNAPRGAWKDASQQVTALRLELDLLEEQCSELAEALTERRGIETELRRIEDPKEKARREADLAEARLLKQTADAHAEQVATAERSVEIASLQSAEAKRALADVETAQTAVADARLALERHTASAELAGQAWTEARAAEDGAQVSVDAAEAQQKGLAAELQAAERAQAAVRATADVARLEKLVAEAQALGTTRADALARVRANPATPEALTAAEEATAECVRLRAAIAARAVSLTVTYSGTDRLICNGEVVPGDVALPLGERAEIEVPGIGRMLLQIPSADDTEDLDLSFAEALAAEAEAIAACGALSLAAARLAARRRQEDVNAQVLAERTLAAIAPDGPGALVDALAEARKLADETPQSGARPLSEIQADLEEAALLLNSEKARLSRLRETASSARAKLSGAKEALMRAQNDLEQAEHKAGLEEDRASLLAGCRAQAVATAAEEARRTEALEALRAAAPDVLTADANLERAESAADRLRQRREELSLRRAGLSAQIETRAAQGIEERREDVAGQLVAAERRAARFAREAEVLARLRDTLETARNAAREAYFGPVQEELLPLLQILHDDAGLDWDNESITPGALRRGAQSEAFETLSGGTQEQIAVLTRLAFARLFARRGQHLPIVLDDALVYSDDERIIKMFNALTRTARNQQIIVFSCRQLAFERLGGARPRILIEAAD